MNINKVPIVPAITSSIIEVCITHPIDIIKIHKQTSKQISYSFKNLYSGFLTRASGNIPTRTVFLFSQDYMKLYCENKKINKSIIVPVTAGFAQTLVDTPIEVMKMNKILNINNPLSKGFIPHLSRNVIFLFFVYNFKNYNVQSTVNTAIYGAIGGFIGSYVSHPFDTIKTFIQSNKSTKTLVLKDYFKGCHLRSSMCMFNMFISLYVFEFMKN
jgi:hypothetical protein